MTLINGLLIIGVIGIAVMLVMYHIKSKKTAEVEVQEVDDQTYTLDEITKVNLYDIGL